MLLRCFSAGCGAVNWSVSVCVCVSVRQNSCLEHERAEPCKNDPADRSLQNLFTGIYFFLFGDLAGVNAKDFYFPCQNFPTTKKVINK